MRKVNWNICEEEKKQILYLHQSATKKHYIISEQNMAKEGRVGTDKTKQPNSALKSKGLKVGKNPDVYYKSTTKQIVDQSLKGSSNNFLAIFQPTNERTEGYHDYLEVGKKNMEYDEKKGTSVAMSVNFASGDQEVYASNNGLLLIWRAMVQMNKAQEPMAFKMEFGTSSDESGMTKERESIVTNLNMNYVMNPYFTTPWFNTILGAIKNTEALEDKNFGKLIGFDVNKLANLMRDYTNGQIQGLGNMGWVPQKQQSEVQKLPGWVNQLDFDYTKPAQEIINFRNESEADEESGQVSKISATKKGQKIIDATYDSFMSLMDKMRKAYLTNLKIYLDTYMPTTGKQIYYDAYSKIMNKELKPLDAGLYGSLFTKTQKGMEKIQPSTIETGTTPHKRGQ